MYSMGLHESTERRIQLQNRSLFLRKIASSCFAALFALFLLGGFCGAQAAQNDAQARALQLLNRDREKHGLAPLVYSTALTELAEHYAADLIARGFFSHNDPDGRSPFDRMRAFGIAYQHAGENLAINDGVEAAQAAFMDSPTHRANVLHPQYTEVGIGVRVAPNGKTYVVQEFIGTR